jgi:PTH1 family peptidyl-tRNA hydrolase
MHPLDSADQANQLRTTDVAPSAQVLLAKPVTFMNNSGESVSALARFYKVPTQRILVVSDDLDMPHAALRLRAKGGHGGHNGLRSISERLGNTQVSCLTSGCAR